MSFYKASLLLAALSGTYAQGQSQAASSAASAAVPVVSGAGGSAQAASSSISVAPGLPSAALASGLPGGITIPLLQELTSGAPSGATAALDSTYTQGSTPTDVSGAPATPTGMLTIANYPELDRTPPVDSPEVQQWLSEIDLSGVPSYAPSTGDCSTDPGAITDGRCWWTCGGCTRETDIVDCPDELTWGTSYDDGPSPYTPLLLDYLNKNDLKTTFFVVGSRVLSRPEMLLSEYMSGHQISIHTWSHAPLTTLSNEEIVAELGWTAKVIRDVIGVTPNTFRPPYGDIDDRVRYIAAQMKQTPIMWTGVPTNNTVQYFDTTDWNIPGNRATGPSALSKFETILNDYVPMLNSGFIVLQHDIYQQTVDLAVGYILPMAIASGKYQLKSIIDCLGLPNSEAYVETSSNNTATHITSAESTVFQPAVGSATGSPVAPSGVSTTRDAAAGSGSGSAASGGSSPSSTGNSASKLASGLNIVPALVAVGAVLGGMAIVA